MIEKRYAISCAGCGKSICGDLIGSAWQKAHRELRERVIALGWALGDFAKCPACIEAVCDERADSIAPIQPKHGIHIRWMIRRDTPEVLYIEQHSFEFPWSEEDIIRCLRQRNCIGMVAECEERVVGFMIYELHKSRLHVLNFAVHPDHRRRGVGRAMVDKLIGKLSPQRRTRILLEVRETNLAAQLFFRSQGFRAIGVLRGFYEETEEDALLMQWIIPLDDRLGIAAEESGQNTEVEPC